MRHKLSILLIIGLQTLAGVANGNQNGYDPFTDKAHPLFYGKAVAVLRSKPGSSGGAVLRVKTDSGVRAEANVNFNDPAVKAQR